MGPKLSASKRATIVQRWQAALRQHEPTLPQPIIDAMIENALKGALGIFLGQLEEGMIELESVDVETLTGSEARTVLAILAHVHRQATQLQTRVQQLWLTGD